MEAFKWPATLCDIFSSEDREKLEKTEQFKTEWQLRIRAIERMAGDAYSLIIKEMQEQTKEGSRTPFEECEAAYEEILTRIIDALSSQKAFIRFLTQQSYTKEYAYIINLRQSKLSRLIAYPLNSEQCRQYKKLFDWRTKFIQSLADNKFNFFRRAVRLCVLYLDEKTLDELRAHALRVNKSVRHTPLHQFAKLLRQKYLEKPEAIERLVESTLAEWRKNLRQNGAVTARVKKRGGV